jgi:hypothetical protein
MEKAGKLFHAHSVSEILSFADLPNYPTALEVCWTILGAHDLNKIL